MAEAKLPRGYDVSDGKTEIHGQIHPEGVIVGPIEADDTEKTFTCTICSNEFKSTAASAVCNGLNTKVGNDGRVYSARIGEDRALTAEDLRREGHSPEPMEVK